MAKLLIKCEKPYHSYIWPHARVGDTRWGDDHLMWKLTQDSGAGFFSIAEVIDDRGEHIQTVHQPEAKEERAAPPKKKPGRPKKVSNG